MFVVKNVTDSNKFPLILILYPIAIFYIFHAETIDATFFLL